MAVAAGAPIRAAQYIRMSTEHQNYSLACQSECNAGYARARGFELVKTYADAGISGLRLQGRDALKRLLGDVIGGRADYEVVLVYDVSRWGRFQDLDQGAHYEFVCREAGVQIVYTAEPFAADGSFASMFLKHLKRAMAAEYSRDLSAKVQRAQHGLRALGYWQGGAPGYGLRRRAVAPNGDPRGRLDSGEWNGARGCRTMLVPGPPEEVQLVRRIYRLFVVDGLRMIGIVQLLNSEGVPAEGGARWSLQRVRQVLTAEKYAGVLVGGKTIETLGQCLHRPRADWVRVEGVIEPLIPRRMFDLAQAQMRRVKPRASDEDLLEELRQVLSDRGRLSNGVINAHPAAHCADVYKRRFGSLDSAYARIGYQPSRRQLLAAAIARRHRPDRFRSKPYGVEHLDALARLKAHLGRVGRVSCDTINGDPDLPTADWYRRRFGGMRRLYALLDYEPPPHQQRRLAQRYRAPPHRPPQTPPAT